MEVGARAKVLLVALLTVVGLMLTWPFYPSLWAATAVNLVGFSVSTPLGLWAGRDRDSRGEYRTYWFTYLSILVVGVGLSAVLTSVVLTNLSGAFQVSEDGALQALVFTSLCVAAFTIVVFVLVLPEDGYRHEAPEPGGRGNRCNSG